MARLLGTGKDPNGQIVEGQFVDAPENSPEYNEAIRNGWAVAVPAGEGPGYTAVEVANRIVRGEPVDSDPNARETADLFKGAGANPEEGIDPHAVVHQQHVEGLPVLDEGEGAPQDQLSEEEREANETTFATRSGDRAFGGSQDVAAAKPPRRSRAKPAAAAEPASEPEAGNGLEDQTVEDLRKEAAELDVPGRSDMDKAELVEAIREAREGAPA